MFIRLIIKDFADILISETAWKKDNDCLRGPLTAFSLHGLVIRKGLDSAENT
jgi:hypothetical protein